MEATCRLCWASVPNVRKRTNLFSAISLKKEWPSRIATLLDVPVSKDDQLPPHVCSTCITRVERLERASTDLADFKRSARYSMSLGSRSLKRTKETTGEVGVSPDTLRERPRSKIARRLQFTSKLAIPCTQNNTQCNHYNTGSTTASCVCEGEQHETSDNVSERPLERDTTSRGLQSCPVPDPVTPACSPAIPPLSSGRDQEGMTVPDPTTSPVMILPHSSPMSAVTFPSGSLTFPHSPVMAPFTLQLDSSHDCNTGAK